MMIKPNSTPDERADFMQSVLKDDTAKRWGGFFWKISFMQPSVARLIADESNPYRLYRFSLRCAPCEKNIIPARSKGRTSSRAIPGRLRHLS